jgi:ferric-dicitrate binding protein FerR (iron transport regulator)
MKLNDPFGRLESRHQKGYESMKASLQQAGIDTPQAARSVVKQAWRRSAQVVAVGIVVLLLLALAIPKALPLALGLGLFLLVWVVSATLNGQRYIKRYVEEQRDD